MTASSAAAARTSSTAAWARTTFPWAAGNDRFQWNPGEGSDVIDGQGGFDTHEFNGSAADEIISLAAGGNDVLLTRNRRQHRHGPGQRRARGDSRGQRRATPSTSATCAARMCAKSWSISRPPRTRTVGDGVNDTVNVSGGTRSEVSPCTASGDDIVVNGLADQMRVANTDVVGHGRGAAAAAASDVINAVGDAGELAHASTLDGGSGNDILFAGPATRDCWAARATTCWWAIAAMTCSTPARATTCCSVAAAMTCSPAKMTSPSSISGRVRARTTASTCATWRASTTSVTCWPRRSGFFGGVVLDFGDDEITLLGVNTSQLHADDFLI